MRFSDFHFTPAQDIDGTSDQQTGSPLPVNRATTGDADLLDAYSQAVIHVVETVSPAVISVTSRDENGRGGGGSGFIVTPDGYAITNSHVVDDRPQLEAETAEGDRLGGEVVRDEPAPDPARPRPGAAARP